MPQLTKLLVARRRRLIALTAVLAPCVGVVVLVVDHHGSGGRRSQARALTAPRRGPAGRAQPASRTIAAAPRPSPPFAVGLRVMRLVDPTRRVHLLDGAAAPRTLVTYVRYPALGPATGGDVFGARPARGARPFPLIVFGHGFALTPGPYAPLLRAWVRAGFVVAAPLFPLENADAPGGPSEADLPNQPADMQFVISRLLAASAAPSGSLSHLIAAHEIAVTGHSDGGDTALAVAYDPRYRDPRIGAAVILSGAELPGLGPFPFPAGGPPLLATQGTADPINPPAATSQFYDSAPSPKFLLQLLGALHLPPYTTDRAELRIVVRVTLTFFDHYLKHANGSVAHRLAAVGNVPGLATLSADP